MAHTYVYILQSLNDPSQHYTGLTDNLKTRLQKHNEGGCPRILLNINLGRYAPQYHLMIEHVLLPSKNISSHTPAEFSPPDISKRKSLRPQRSEGRSLPRRSISRSARNPKPG